MVSKVGKSNFPNSVDSGCNNIGVACFFLFNRGYTNEIINKQMNRNVNRTIVIFQYIFVDSLKNIMTKAGELASNAGNNETASNAGNN